MLVAVKIKVDEQWFTCEPQCVGSGAVHLGCVWCICLLTVASVFVFGCSCRQCVDAVPLLTGNDSLVEAFAIDRFSDTVCGELGSCHQVGVEG